MRGVLGRVAVNFRTGYHDKNGHLVIRSHTVAANYLKGWCVVDVVSCLPISYINMLGPQDSAGGANPNRGSSVRALKILRMLRLAKLLRVARIARMLDRYREVLRPLLNTFGGFFLCVVIAVFSHIVACMWYFVGNDAQLGQSGPMGEAVRIPGWVERKFHCGDGADWASGGNAVDDDHHRAAAMAATVVTQQQQDSSGALTNLSAASHSNVTAAEELWCDYNDSYFSRYVLSMYWALMTISTVGFGDITSKTQAEMVFSFFVMLFGAIIFALITGRIASEMMSQKGQVQQYHTMMDDIRHFLDNKSVEVGLRRTVMTYYDALHEGGHLQDERAILEPLPIGIAGPVVREIYGAIMDASVLFRSLKTKDDEDDDIEIMVKIWYANARPDFHTSKAPTYIHTHMRSCAPRLPFELP